MVIKYPGNKNKSDYLKPRNMSPPWGEISNDPM